MGKDKFCNGDDFNACFAKMLRDIIKKCGIEEEVHVIGNILIDFGLTKYL